MNQIKMRALLIIILISFIPGLLIAHPHIWIDVSFSPMIQNGVVESVRIQWYFDEWYSASYLIDFDENGDRNFTGSEVDNIYQNAFSALSDIDYFTVVESRGRELELGIAREFNASMLEGRLIYDFVLDISHSPAADSPLSVFNIDATNYIAFFTESVVIRGDRSLRAYIDGRDYDLQGFGARDLPVMIISRL